MQLPAIPSSIKIVLKNSFFIIIAVLSGSFINLSIVQLGHQCMPIEGLAPEDMASLAKIMPQLETKHFIFPFIAHASGTFVAAFMAAYTVRDHERIAALIPALFFLAGGVTMTYMLPAPIAFELFDVVFAYLPMAWLGYVVALKLKTAKNYQQ